jgi:hypothetical protein
MVKKKRKTKGQKPPPEPKTDRKETTTEERAVIARAAGRPGESTKGLAEEFQKHRTTIWRVQKRAKERAIRTGRPLTDINNLRTERKRHYTVRDERTERRIEREVREHNHGNLDLYKSDLQLPFSKSTLLQILYDKHLSHNVVAVKPALNRDNRTIRLALAKELRKVNLRRVCWIDAANVRLDNKGGKERAWMENNSERFDEKNKTERGSGYSTGQFFGVIKHWERPGPCVIIKTESEAEKKEAEAELNKENTSWRSFDTLQFVAQEAKKEADALDTGKKARGRRAKLDVFVNSMQRKRGNRDRGGVDWYRFCNKYLEPLLAP